MLLACLNTWKNDGNYRQRLQLCKEQTFALNPDILFLQEVFSTENLAYNTVKDIASYCSKPFYMVKARLKNREIEGENLSSSAGLSIITHLPVLKHWEIILPSNEADGGRKAQLLEILYLGNKIIVVNLHLSHIRDAHDLRLDQIQAILSNDKVSKASTVIMAGDFNALIEFPELQYLMTQGFEDCFKNFPQINQGTSPLDKQNQRKKIDFIFIKSNQFKLNHPTIVYNQADNNGNYPSDHLGVSCMLELY